MTTTNATAPRDFTNVFVRGFKNETGKRIEIRDTRITGLVMRVTPKNKKTFTLHTRTPVGDKVQITIGAYPAISLKDAREIAMNHIADIRRGHDPREQARLAKALAQAQSLTLTDLLDEIEPIFALTKSTWRAGSRDGRTKPEARAAIENVFQSLLGKPLNKVSQSDVAKAVKGYTPKRPRIGKTSANGSVARALTYLRPVFDWASNRGRFRKEGAGREPKLELPDLALIHDPSIDDPTLEGKRDRVLTQDELISVMPLLVYPAPAGLRSNLDPHEDYGPVAFRFLFLTLSRREEVTGARRKDIDLRAGTWTKTVKTRRKPGSMVLRNAAGSRSRCRTQQSTFCFRFRASSRDSRKIASSPRRVGALSATGTERRTPSIRRVEHLVGTVMTFGGLRQPSWVSWRSSPPSPTPSYAM